jgi:hypothetical protein
MNWIRENWSWLLLTVILAALWALLWDFFPGVNIHGEPVKATGVTVKSLKRSYAEYNAEYFENKLPKDTIIEYNLDDSNFVALTSKFSDGRFHIGFNPAYTGADRFADLVMLHEMCHVDNWGDNHGRKWRACMIELDLRGAFREELIDSYEENKQ